MAVTSTVNLVANTSGAVAPLNKLQKQVEGINKQFSGLGKTLGGLAIGNFVFNMLKSADAISDVATAANVSISTVTALGKAFALSGGEAKDADTALLGFNQSIQDAANGSDKTIKAFKAIGISIEDIGRLSEEELLKKTIEGLGKLGNSSEAVAIKMELFTKIARGIDFTNVNKQFGDLEKSAKEAEPGIAAAAKLFDNLQKLKSDFGTALAKEFAAPLNALVELSGGTTKLAETLASLTKTVIVATGVWAIFYKVLPGIKAAMDGLFAVLASGRGAFSFLTSMIDSLKDGFGRLKTGTGSVADALGNTGSAAEKAGQRIFTLSGMLAALARGFLRFVGIAGIIYTVVDAVNTLQKAFTGFDILDWIGNKISSVFNKVKEFFALLMYGDTGYFKEQAAELKELEDELQEVTVTSKTTRDRLKELREENDKYIDSVKELTNEFVRQNAQRQKNLEDELKYIDMSQDAIELDKNRAAIQKDLLQVLTELEKKRKEALGDPSKGASVVAAIDNEIKKVKENAAAHTKATEEIIKKMQARRLEHDKVLMNLDVEKKKMEDAFNLRSLEKQLATLGLYGDELERTNMILDVTDELQKKILGYQQDLMDLEVKRTEIGEERYQAERDRILKLQNQAYEYAGARLDIEDKIQKKQKETSDSASLALKKYFDDMAKNTTPAKLAVDAVGVVFEGMNTSLQKFMDTGKVSWKDFTNVVVDGLKKIAAQAIASKIFQIGGSFFNKLVGSIFGGGKAAGGPVTANTPYLVGEKGPEMFVPKTNGTIVPNNELNGQSRNRNMMGSGSVTNNYITNNISAIDAKSVAQLFAENRKTLLGTVRMAESELPYMAR